MVANAIESEERAGRYIRQKAASGMPTPIASASSSRPRLGRSSWGVFRGDHDEDWPNTSERDQRDRHGDQGDAQVLDDRDHPLVAAEFTRHRDQARRPSRDECERTGQRVHLLVQAQERARPPTTPRVPTPMIRTGNHAEPRPEGVGVGDGAVVHRRHALRGPSAYSAGMTRGRRVVGSIGAGGAGSGRRRRDGQDTGDKPRPNDEPLRDVEEVPEGRWRLR